MNETAEYAVWYEQADAIREHANSLPLTLVNVKIVNELSEETLCYVAEVRFQGKPIAHVKNDGHGGETYVTFFGDRCPAEQRLITEGTRFRASDVVMLWADNKAYEIYNKKASLSVYRKGVCFTDGSTEAGEFRMYKYPPGMRNLVDKVAYFERHLPTFKKRHPDATFWHPQTGEGL